MLFVSRVDVSGWKGWGRWSALLGLGLIFLAINLLTRLGLYLFSGDWREIGLELIPALGIGLLYDLAALAYVLPLFGLLAWVCPNSPRGQRVHGWVHVGLLGAALVGALFVSLSEFVFWNEFGVRFNFIAVDYLIYTREVLGNIRQSYPVGWILSGLLLLALAVLAVVVRPQWRLASGPGLGLGGRSARLLGVLALPVLSFALMGDAPRLWLNSSSARELSGNGYYDFMRAFRNNDLSFEQFYTLIAKAKVPLVVQHELKEGLVHAVSDVHGITHARKYAAPASPQAPLNLVLVSMESFGAEFVEALGGQRGLTPTMNRLAKESLFFTQTYATGLRTVRGLEALTLSLPPLPGHAIPVRKDNKAFPTLGGVLKKQGYQSLYLYGGYAPFDNMLDFFGGNGYEVLDRTEIAADHISHETIWGVADEDLFHHALGVLDERTAQGQPVFAHIMTTSNHRPFTYPSGRIDLPSGSSREGAVKYADWAVGDFLQRAAQKPWFKNTVFVLVADHTSRGRGRVDLEPQNFHIPFLVYAPGRIAPRQVHTLNSQIDVAPTVLALLGIGYDSYFYGHDILTEGQHHPRAFLGNYLTVGYLEDGRLVQLMPNRKSVVMDAKTLQVLPIADPRQQELLQEAIGQYQYISDWVQNRPRQLFAAQR